MKYSIIRTLVFLVMYFFTQNVFSQEYSKIHILKAEKVIASYDYLEKDMDQSIEDILDTVTTQYPMLASYKNDIRKTLTEVYSYKELKKYMVKIYLENFTENELDEINKFTESPIGKKMKSVIPNISKAQVQMVKSGIPTYYAKLDSILIKEAEKQEQLDKSKLTKQS